MSSKQLLIEAFHGSFFGTPSFNRGICTVVHVKFFVKLNSASAIVGTAKLFGARFTHSSAFQKMQHPMHLIACLSRKL